MAMNVPYLAHNLLLRFFFFSQFNDHITYLSMIIDNLSFTVLCLATTSQQLGKSFPKLHTLSMMNNPAAPSYFNGGTPQDQQEYRCVGVVNVNTLVHKKGVTVLLTIQLPSLTLSRNRLYVISQLPKLAVLDDTKVTYGTPRWFLSI